MSFPWHNPSISGIEVDSEGMCNFPSGTNVAQIRQESGSESGGVLYVIFHGGSSLAILLAILDSAIIQSQD
jgi:hypothetical protein